VGGLLISFKVPIPAKAIRAYEEGMDYQNKNKKGLENSAEYNVIKEFELTTLS
jgi:hypothetical protein